MINWSNCQVVESAKERVSGSLVFAGSRVPIAALFENLEDGITAQEFTEIFPGIKLEQVKAVLDFVAKNSLYAA
ncbi:DUF433 domain-containing protein [Polynucleobacter kasalickyi]|uniref:Uncharacterized conserved protein, DUF433 family n=1 Tax=Polynucleobacter kasalickyi TaxID=1938817 RepID=A0A1W1ZXB2_9BURK|nr:DUF433 domain-containing protein [Polynucleobacter kasalickyi]SMC52708.1 Uncharacterized conserved protein, DUF433 family [Polynucleobacter kasalickyi]